MEKSLNDESSDSLETSLLVQTQSHLIKTSGQICSANIKKI